MLSANELPVWFVRLVAFAFGAVWGSFGNVVIYRVPRELSVVSPPSHCFSCGKPVRAFDNVPIFAWFWLRGKCRSCKAPFSIRYPMVELLFAIVSTLIAERLFFHSPELSFQHALALYAVRFSVAFGLLVTAFIDLDKMEFPAPFMPAFTVAPLVSAFLLPTIAPGVDGWTAFAGAALGYLGVRLLFVDGFRLLRGYEGMGDGDPEIVMLIGALLGPAGAAFALGAGSIQGVLAVAVAWLFGKRIGPEVVGGESSNKEEKKEEKATEKPAAASEPPSTSEEKKESAPSENAANADESEEDDEEEDHGLKVPFGPFLALGALEYLLGGDVLFARAMQWIQTGEF